MNHLSPPLTLPFKMLQHAPHGLIWIHADGRCQANLALQSMLGCPEHFCIDDLSMQGPLEALLQENLRCTDQWAYQQNPALQVQLTCTSAETPDGPLLQAWVEDLTRQSTAEQVLLETQKINEIVADISTQLIYSQQDSIDELIEQGLGRLGTITQVDRVYVFLFDPQNLSMSNTHEWAAEGVTLEKENLQHLPLDLFPWWMEKLGREEVINVPHVRDLPPEASAEKDILEMQSIQSVLVIPLILHGELLGFMGFDAVQIARSWASQTVAVLQLYGQAVTHALSRIRQEKIIERHHQLLSSLFSASPDMVMMMDFSGDQPTLQLVSPSVQGILGYRPDVLSGMPYDQMLDLIHPEDRVSLDEFQELLLQQQLRKSRLRVRSRGGEYIPCEVHLNLMQNGEKPSGMVAIVRDIRSQIAQETLLKESLQRAEKASQAKSQFLSRMSHELRTPMNAILASSQILQLRGLQDSQARGVQRILTAGNHLLTLIDDILDISRIESGQLAVQLEPTQVNPVIEQALEMVRSQAAEAGITLESDLQAREDAVADPGRLQQVMLNLLSNGIKYNTSGGRVTVYSRSNGVSVRIGVKDTGLGIDREDFEKVFAPFARFGPYKDTAPGTGIGLALCKTLVDSMQGTLSFQSQVGEGSHFHLDLPLAAGHVFEEASSV